MIFGFAWYSITTSIKTLWLGSSGEYTSNEFHDFLQPKGIIFQKYSPQNVTGTLLFEASVPSQFW